MSRLAFFACLILACLSLTALGCAKSGASRDEKVAALTTAQETARAHEVLGDKIIEMTESHGKMIVIIPEGLHPQQEAEFLQEVGMAWYDAYPEGKKPTINDMVQVWLYQKDRSKDEVGFVKVYSDEYGKLQMDFHHYKTQQAM